MSVHITAFEAERFKRLRAVTLEPSAEGLTVIGGRNGQGKTSVLDAIVFALGGEKYRPSEGKSRDAAGDLSIRIELSNGLVVERKGKNSALKVTGAPGFKGSQGVLDGFIEKLALDLPKFMQSSDKEKAEILLQIIGAGDALAELDAKEAELYDNRRLVGREADQAEKELAGMVVVERELAEAVSTADILDEIEAATVLRNQRDALAAEKQRYVREIDGHEQRLRELKGSLAESGQEMAGIEVPDIEPLKERLASAEEDNERVRAAARYRETEAVAVKKRDYHGELEQEIAAVRLSREQLLENADMPLDNLGIVDGELVYQGSRWDCMSSAEQLMVATSIVKKLNPECGFVLVDKLEQMDVDSMNEFGAWAEGQGLQIIATRVSTGDECSIVIEDGMVEGPPLAEHNAAVARTGRN